MLLGLAFWSLTLRILELILAIGLAFFLVYLAFMAIIFVGTIIILACRKMASDRRNKRL
ncbi:hypothetical protein HMPREF0525_01507 [Lactobacillus jensenii 27-2-CHN]|nr:hypothetical protein HMPREF0525_01507 [Lactobacillus jensenii 27-2-CHN]